MKKFISFITLIALFALSGFSEVVFSNGNYPSADGGNIDSAPANVEGELIEVTASTLVIEKKGGTEKVKVKLTENTDYFTAFGGFVRPDELRSGQVVWVWFENCDSSKDKDSLPKAKTVKVYSLDPNDRP